MTFAPEDILPYSSQKLEHSPTLLLISLLVMSDSLLSPGL